MSTALPPELAALEQRFVLREREIVIGTHGWRLEMPRSAEDLISESEFERDERLPYWADLWPSAIALAEEVTSLDGTGCLAVELGAGLGLPSVAAAHAGYDMTVTDYYEDALLFARRNALRNGARDPAVRLLDWRALPDGFGRFDLVLAADVLYERAYAPLVAQAVLETLAPGGTALLADPGRVALGACLAELAARGAVVRERRTVRYEEDVTKHTITIFEVRLG